ncbi:hypothetical protein G7K_3097-t1 [Saitoella complicata NRRL Y-17804]|uniref:ENTH domain-containing protein n=2 Tax=Saitoella complicata (strain BCRC 22490 / CBS 7301 / JCM 7358 / NBRC 10748 / NRRL Y-17804) TaxID=698492 RepID=A0A0E9NHQ7_SAICN|nr:hypothetical protein G7K_3097-t1 [Saitoella complicata NRRL Y-17804]
MSVKIQLKDQGKTFTNLDYVEGTVLLDLRTDEDIEKVTVKLEGVSRSVVMAPRRPGDRKEKPYVEIHKLLHREQVVFPPADIRSLQTTSSGSFTLPTGQYTYPFRLRIPINHSCTEAPPPKTGAFSLNNLASTSKGITTVSTPLSHVKAILPPSVAGGEDCFVKYFVKVTVSKKAFYKANYRAYDPFIFLPIEPPRPVPQGGLQVFARKEEQFGKKKGGFFAALRGGGGNGVSGSVMVEARLPNPPVLTPTIPTDLVIMLNSAQEATVADLQLRLLSTTRITAHGHPVKQTHALKLPTPHPLHTSGARTLTMKVMLPDSVVPTFRTCNLERGYVLEVTVMVESAGQVSPVTLVMGIQVFSGMKPPAGLVARDRNGKAQAAAPAYPLRPATGSGKEGLSPALPERPPPMPARPSQQGKAAEAAAETQAVPVDNVEAEVQLPPTYDEVLTERLEGESVRMASLGRGVMRSVKNMKYSDIQVKVREATSNEEWGPSGADMNEIAQLTFNHNDLLEVMDMLDKRMNDKGKNWRHVFKALTVLDYIVHSGSENVVNWAKDNLYIIKTLREFQYVDEEAKDQGANVRQKAKDLTALLQDDERLRAERKNRSHMRDRLSSRNDDFSAFAGRESQRPRRQRTARDDDDDEEMRRAIEESKRLAELEARGSRPAPVAGDEDDDLQRALKLSKEEEERRQVELNSNTAATLFDDTFDQPTTMHGAQGYQQGPAVDFFGNPYGQQAEFQQPQYTGYVQPQQTAFMQPDQTGYQQQQFGYDQYQQPVQQPQYVGVQPTGYNNPYAQQQQQQQVMPQPTGSNNPYAQANQPQAIAPQPTGSNNPFAQFGQVSQAPRPQSANAGKPSLNSLQMIQEEERQREEQARQDDPRYAKLASLIGAGNASGLDTFGNTGDLRLPSQHTAAAYVNSAGRGGLNNPFLSGQVTGAVTQRPLQPTMTGVASNVYTSNAGFNAQNGGAFGQSPFGAPQQQQQQQQQQYGMQAQATGYAQPQQQQAFGQQQWGQQQQGGHQQSGSLIDL